MASEVFVPIAAVNAYDFPPICIVTGERNVEWHQQKFQWTPQWATMLIAFIGLIGVIIAMIKRKQAKVELPYSPEAWERLRKGKWIGYGSLATMLPAAMIAGPVWMINVEPISGLIVMLGLLIAPFIILHQMVTKRGPKVTEITDTHIRLSLPNELAAVEIRNHFGGR